MSLRKVTIDDIDDIFAVRVSVKENLLDREQLRELGITEESVKPMITDTHYCYCIEVGEEVVAFVMAEKETATIFGLFVNPDHEGKGYGKQLLSAALEDLRASGHEQAILTTDKDSRAHQFYLRQGWEFVGDCKNGEVELRCSLS